MGDDLKLLIQTELEKVSWKNVNDQLEELKKKYETSGISIKINDETTKTLQDFAKSMDKVQNILKEQRRTVEQDQAVYKELDGTIKTITRTVDAMGNVITKTKTVHDSNKKAMQDETIAAMKLTDAIEGQNKANVDSITAIKNRAGAITGFNVKSSEGYKISSINLESDGQTLKGARISTNYKKQREDELKEQAQLDKQAEAIDKAHYQALKTNQDKIEAQDKMHYIALKQNRDIDLKEQQEFQKQAELIDKAHYQALKTDQERFEAQDKQHYIALQKNREFDLKEQQASDAQEKQHYLALQENQKRDEDFAKRKLDLISKIQDVQRRYAGDKNVGSLGDLFNKAQDVEFNNYKNNISQIDSELKKVTSTMATARSNSMSFGDALKQAFEKFPIWLIAGTTMMQGLHFFTEGISYVNELNATLTQISTAVNYNQEKVAELGKSYQNLAVQLGATTAEVAKGALEFYRQGLNDDQVLTRLKTTTEYAKISGLEFTQSADLLTAASNSMHEDIGKVADVFTLLGKHYCPLAS